MGLCICLHKVILLRHSISDPSGLLKHISAGIASLFSAKTKIKTLFSCNVKQVPSEIYKLYSVGKIKNKQDKKYYTIVR